MPYLPDNNLDYPVLIAVGQSVGSGFFYNAQGGTFLVSAKHVFYNGGGALHNNNAILTSYVDRFAHRVRLTVDLAALADANHIRSHAAADVVVLRVITPNNEGHHALNAGVEFLENPQPGVGIVGVSPQNVRLLNQVGISNDVFVFGYPISIGAVGQLEPDKPLIRRGTVAGLNLAAQKIVIDAPAYQGNSGGLVIECELEQPGVTRFRAIGVVTEFVPFFEETISIHFGTKNRNVENSGYSIVAPMDRVLETIW